MRIRRMARVVAVLLAVFLVLSMALSLVGAVDAAPAERKPRHNLKVDAKEIDGADRFVLYGKVTGYPRAKIVVVRNVAGGSFAKVEKIKTSRHGRFRTRIVQVGDKVTCYKVVVPKTPDFRTRSKGALCIDD